MEKRNPDSDAESLEGFAGRHRRRGLAIIPFRATGITAYLKYSETAMLPLSA